MPLVAGAADAVRDAGIACFGPSEEAAQLEGSKSFAKHVMTAAGVPTAQAWPVGGPAELETALDEVAVVSPGMPYVVKDDGLAAGKGVLVTPDRAAAVAHGRAVLDAGHAVLIEEYLDGPEVSLFAVTDGTTVVPLVPAQDHKRRDDGDAGPNTGGMGAYAPLPWAPPGLVDEVLATVLQPTVDEMARRGEPFSGLLYAGLALTSRGVRVVEFNARFGDPETQVVLPLLETPLAGLLHAAATGTLADHPPLRVARRRRRHRRRRLGRLPGGAAHRRPGHRVPTARASCTRARRSARTARWSRPAVGCWPSPPSVPTSPPRGRPPTSGSPGSGCPGRTGGPTSGWPPSRAGSRSRQAELRAPGSGPIVAGQPGPVRWVQSHRAPSSAPTTAGERLVNKTELVSRLTARLDGDRAKAMAAVNGVLEEIEQSLARGEKVSLFGFGTFDRRERGPRTARNPATGETIQVGASVVPVFRAGAGLRQLLAEATGTRAATAQATSPRRGAGVGRRGAGIDAARPRGRPRRQVDVRVEGQGGAKNGAEGQGGCRRAAARRRRRPAARARRR